MTAKRPGNKDSLRQEMDLLREKLQLSVHNEKVLTERVRELEALLSLPASSPLPGASPRESLHLITEKYQAIFQHANDAILLLHNGIFIDCNPMAERLFGLGREEILGSRPEELSPERQSDGSRSEDLARKLLEDAAQQESLDFEWKHKKNDGTLFDADIRLSQILMDGERIILSIVRDITKQKQTELALKYERAYFEQLFQGVPEGVVLLDKNDRVIDFNKAFGEMFGYEKAEAHGRPINDLIVPDNLREEGQRTTNQVAEGRSLEMETVRRAKDGSLLHVFVTGRPLDIPSGQTAVIGVYRNISSLKETERRLKQEKDKFIKIVETSPGAICSLHLDAGGNASYPYASPSIEDVLGFAPDQLMDDARLARERVHVEDLQRLEREILVSAGKMKPWYSEYRYRHPRKGMVWIETRFVPERQPTGSTQWYGYLVDITKEKEKEIREQILLEITHATLSTSDIEELIHKVRLSLDRMIDTSNYYIALYDRDTDILSIPYEKDQMDQIESWPAAKSVTGLVVGHQRPLLLDKPAILSMIRHGVIQQVGNMCEVWLGVPLFSGQDVIGAIVLQDYKNPGAFNRESQTLLEYVSTHVSLAIQRQQGLEELRFQSLILDQIQDRVTVTDMTGKIIYVNEAESRGVGVPGEELVGANIVSYGASEEKKALRRHILEETSRMGQWRGEVQVDREGDSATILDVRTSLVTNPLGKAIGMCAISSDVTERKKMEEQRGYHLGLQQLLSSISSELVGANLSNFDKKVRHVLHEMGTFFEVDRAYLFKYSDDGSRMDNTHEWCAGGVASQKELLQGFPVEKLSWLHERIFANEVLAIGNIDEMPAGAEEERRILGELGLKAILNIPVRRSGGKIYGFFGLDSVHRERAWKQPEIGLMQIISNILTDAIGMVETEASLVAAREKAEESDRLKSAFLANVSHEIRTPMNAIVGFLELLKQPRLEDDQKADYVGIVNKSAQRLLETINAIVELSKLESGQSELRVEKTDASLIMQEIHALFTPQAREKGLEIRLEKHVSGQEAIIMTDRHKLEGILINLVNNARKFTSHGYIELGSYGEKGQLVFYVKDTGAGIEENKQKDIFERFVQADLSTSRGYEGAGLGLSIVRAYLQLMGGKIWLKSKPGQGSTFYFSIPYTPATEPKKEEEEIAAPPEQKAVPAQTILVAEDDDASYYLLEIILADENFRLIRCICGEDAIRLMKENNDISLVLMDIKMPGMDGITATREIRSFNTSIPIIAQTAHAMSGDREKALESGCNDYITKPLSKNNLIQTISRFLKPH